jgi:choline dehydrogenase-like flavoprotein
MAHFLTDAQFHTLTALCDTFIPSIERGDDPHGFWKRKASDLDVPTLVTRAVRDLQMEHQQRDFKLILDVLGKPLTAGLVTGQFRPFAKLSPAAREKVLQNWSVSPVPQLRRAFQGLKRLTCGLYYSALDESGRSPNWPALHYPGPFTVDGSKPPRRITPMKVAGDLTLKCDVVVVGSGAGGGVVAGELARAGKDVVVLEKGGYYSEEDFDGNEFTAYQKLYENQAILTSDDLSVVVLAGSALGGGTVINWCASFRTPQHVLEEWEHEHACTGMAGPDYQASLDAVCARLNVNTDESWPSKEAALLEQACAVAGYPCHPIPRNVKGCGECGWCVFGCALGAKQSTLKTYLQDAAECGARFVVNAHVDKVMIENGRAVGVEARVDGQTVTVRAKNVVVSAGALHSPALLLRSGLDDPNIGSNLRLHPTVPIFGEYAEPVEIWRGTMLARYSDQLANMDGRHYGVTIEHPPAHPGLLGLGQVWLSGAQHKEALSRSRHRAVFIGLTRDRDSGRITVDKQGRPTIHYTISTYDRVHMERGVEALFELHAAAGATEIGSTQSGLEPYRPGGALSLDDYLARVRARGFAPNMHILFSAHQMGTCRMGGMRAKSVLDPNGESWDVRHLYVADASTFPTASGLNPMITIMALAHKTAQYLKTRG